MHNEPHAFASIMANFRTRRHAELSIYCTRLESKTHYNAILLDWLTISELMVQSSLLCNSPRNRSTPLWYNYSRPQIHHLSSLATLLNPVRWPRNLYLIDIIDILRSALFPQIVASWLAKTGQTAHKLKANEISREQWRVHVGHRFIVRNQQFRIIANQWNQSVFICKMQL